MSNGRERLRRYARRIRQELDCPTKAPFRMLRHVGLRTYPKPRTAQRLDFDPPAGVPAYAAETWYGLVAPTGTPRAIILRLNNALVRIFQHPDIGARLAADGARVTAGAPRQFADHLATENTKWGTVLEASALSVN